MITRIKVKCRRTFVFNERGNTDPTAFIYVNMYTFSEAMNTVERFTDKPVILVDCYPLRKKNHKRYDKVPAWAV